MKSGFAPKTAITNKLGSKQDGLEEVTKWERRDTRLDSAQCCQPPGRQKQCQSAGPHLTGSHAVEDTGELAPAAAGSVRWHTWPGDYIQLNGYSDMFIPRNKNVILHKPVH